MITRLQISHYQVHAPYVGARAPDFRAAELAEATVRAWKVGPDAGDTNALVRALKAALIGKAPQVAH